ncbi:putative helicase mov-10-B.1 [Microplitis mediator]|uniref:putative helicase mov-10-B.1 n=1 Tax=Microplitis mediator TaxID=375433 RepID=UPI002555AE23|nr:putative helicase mov-10-B.1 [Microplitis mediator]
MMEVNNRSELENVIKSKSTRDCIDGMPPLSMGGAFIPAQLSEVLDNNVKPFQGMTEIHAQYYAIVSGLDDFDYSKLDEQNYWYVWKLLLYIEYHQCIKDMQKYSLLNQGIGLSEKRPNEFIVAVPGLQEDRPSLREYDEIELLQVNGKNNCVGVVTHVGKDYVAIDVPASFRNSFTRDQVFNIEFRIDDWSAKCWNYILDTVDKDNITRMLFPVMQSSTFVPDNCKFKWINDNINRNPEQQQAIINIVNKTSYPASYVLFGPPGTGKTSTVVEAICQIMKKNPSTKILICTPSNAAADEIAERLLKNLGAVEDDFMYRMYSSSRSVDDVKPTLKTFSNFADRKTVFVNKEVFMTKKIVITTLATAIRLHGYKLRENYFGYLFVDEAGQATELDTLIPLVLMCGKDSLQMSKFSGQVVIAGDPKQLGPTVQSKLAEVLLGKSMLERLMNWPLYKKGDDKKYNSRYVTKLIQNYRCHEAILSVPNSLFYDGELVAKGGKHTTRAVGWSMLPKKKFPVVFHAVKGKEGRKNYSPSVHNDREIGQVVSYVRRLLNSNLGGKIVKPEDIGIVTPYKLQRNLIHKALADFNITNVPVGTVEIFQGQEKDIIIITTVRSVVYKTEENKYHIGFLSNPKRFNVALTRAKSLLIVIGHPDILQQDYCWRAFVKYCVNNNACCGETFVLDKSLDGLDIRKISSVKVRKELKLPAKKIVEDSGNSAECREIDFRDLPRRRRAPSGPVSANQLQTSNKINELLMNFDNDYHQQFNMDEDIPFSDESDVSEESVDEDDSEVIDPAEQFDSNSRMAKDMFANYLKKLCADEDTFEAELHNRMKSLVI